MTRFALSKAFADPNFHRGLDRLADAMPAALPVADVLKAAMDFLNITVDKRRHDIIEVTGAVAGSDHDGDYHGTGHFSDVTACGAFLLGHIPNDLSEAQKFNFLIFLALHDIFHDGKANLTPQGHVPFRLEDNSYRAAEALLRPFGLSEDELLDLKALFRATDISKAAPNALSPAEKVRGLDRAALSQEFYAAAKHDEAIERFIGRPDLHFMAQLAQAADLMPSGAMNLAYTLQNSHRLERENGTPATPSSFNFFAEKIAHPAFREVPRVGRELLRRLSVIQRGVSLLPEMRLVTA